MHLHTRGTRNGTSSFSPFPQHLIPRLLQAKGSTYPGGSPLRRCCSTWQLRWHWGRQTEKQHCIRKSSLTGPPRTWKMTRAALGPPCYPTGKGSGGFRYMTGVAISAGDLPFPSRTAKLLTIDSSKWWGIRMKAYKKSAQS